MSTSNNTTGGITDNENSQFRCMQCRYCFGEMSRFEDTTICNDCAYRSGLLPQLASERDRTLVSRQQLADSLAEVINATMGQWQQHLRQEFKNENQIADEIKKLSDDFYSFSERVLAEKKHTEKRISRQDETLQEMTGAMGHLGHQVEMLSSNFNEQLNQLNNTIMSFRQAIESLQETVSVVSQVSSPPLPDLPPPIPDLPEPNPSMSGEIVYCVHCNSSMNVNVPYGKRIAGIKKEVIPFFTLENYEAQTCGVCGETNWFRFASRNT